MKRCFCIILGVCAGLLAGTLAVYLFNTWFAANYVHSDDDANPLVTLALITVPVFGLTGGIVANRLFGRRCT